MRRLAQGYFEYDDYINTGAGAAERILAISDMHVPFNLPVSMFSKYSGNVDTIVIGGDLLDCASMSVFPKKYKFGIDDELVAAYQYMSELIGLVRPKKVVAIMGNHEYRMQRYLADHVSQDLMGILPTDPLSLLFNDGFTVKDAEHHTATTYMPLREAFDIEIEYDCNWWCKVGNVIFAHPLSYSSGMLKTAEKAMNYFFRVDRTFTALAMAHTHKIGSYVQGGIKIYEQGCVCDLSRLDYNNGKLVLPNQNGYMYICLDGDGNIIDNKTKLISF